MTALRQRAVIVLVALAAAGAGLLLNQNRDFNHASVAGDATAMMQLTLLDANGTKLSMGQWRGKVLVVNFWATWCAPCREEMPEFSRVSQEYATKDVQFVGIGIDTVDNLRNFTRDFQVAYPLLVGEGDAMQASVAVGNKVMALPFTAILSRTGKVTQVKLGKMSAPELRDAVARALGAD